MAASAAARWSLSKGGQLRMPRFRKEWLVRQAETRVSSAALVVVAYAGNMSGAERKLLCESLGVRQGGGGGGTLFGYVSARVEICEDHHNPEESARTHKSRRLTLELAG